ncbi:MAG: nuclear transport factor 2 family protein [Deltaproteobacteria bacterium]|nr:nuclear transport factor 2 family protein [Deltaproteobacteria bacterium]
MRLLVVAALGAVMLSCGPAYIQGTTVPDTAENRDLLDAVEQYRLAVEQRDAGALVELIARGYFENASTTADAKDDYGFEQLIRKVMPVLQDNVKKVLYKISVEKVSIKGGQASAFFEYELTFQYVEGGLEGWATGKDKNRLDFVLEDGRWKIIAGL